MSQYTLYIDETGIRYPQHKAPSRRDKMDWFGWCGVLIKKEDEEQIVHKIKTLRKRWNINYPLHSSEIRGNRDNFSWLKVNSQDRDNFFDDLNELLIKIPVTSFSTVISRPGYNQRFKEKYGHERWELCKSAHPILLERVVRHLVKNDSNARLRIIFEGASGAENKLIKDYTRQLKHTSHPFSEDAEYKYQPLSPHVYNKIIIGDAESAPKTNFFLQIADLYAYPIAKCAYISSYLPWVKLFEAGRIIDATLAPDERAANGIKYYCFDDSKQNTQTEA